MKKVKALVLGLVLTVAGAAYTVSARAQATTPDNDRGSCCCCCCCLASLFTK